MGGSTVATPRLVSGSEFDGPPEKGGSSVLLRPKEATGGGCAPPTASEQSVWTPRSNVPMRQSATIQLPVVSTPPTEILCSLSQGWTCKRRTKTADKILVTDDV